LAALAGVSLATAPLLWSGGGAASLRRHLATGLVLGGSLAVAVVLALGRRTRSRVQRLVVFASKLATDEAPPYLAPERPDDLGLLEGRLAEMTLRVDGTISDLRVERERLEAILRGMVEGVLVTDLAGTVALLNARARELLGLATDASPAGRPLVTLTRDPALGELMRELAAGAGIASRDVMLSAGTGTGPTLQVNAARLRGIDGAAFGYVLVLHDVTELRRLEVIRRDFVANVSHELRTPLTAIHGWARMLMSGAMRDAQRQTALETIERNARAQTRLIDDLLDVSRVVGGNLHLDMREVAVADVVEHAIDSIRPAAHTRNIAIDTRVDPDAGHIPADPERLQQIIWNLLSNAVKFTPEGGRVQLDAARVGDEIHLTVADNGVGISAEFLPHVFERFRQQHVGTTRQYGGLGLGLAIVRHLVALHGGSITAESAGDGRGATFRVRLPAGAAISAAVARG